MLLPQIDFKASEPVRVALSTIGRTEDVRFSPNNRLLAIAGYTQNRCLILRIDVEAGPGGPVIALSDFLELTSDRMRSVHGFDFIDDRTLVIGNRDGLVEVFSLPSGELGGRRCRVDPVRQIADSRFCRLKNPGSITVMRAPNGEVSLLVCNNYTHKITQHFLRARFRLMKNRVLLQNGLNIPDGIALSHDGRWIAVSSHGTHDVKIYDTSKTLGRKTRPAGVLQNANYPHGLRFTADDKHIVVADAGGPVLYVHDRGAGWEGAREPARTVTVIDEETFARGRHNPMEGGPKGLDIDRSNTVVAVTCEEQTLAFFSLAAILGEDRREQPEFARTA